MHDDTQPVSRTMLALGLAGLIPFMAAVLGVWYLDGLLRALSQRAFLTYSVAILCFLAGTLWGETLANPGKGEGPTILISNGVVLFAVFAVLTAGPLPAAGLLLLGHLAQLWYERQRLLRARWYTRMRTGLTLAVAVCHGLFIAGLTLRATG